MKLFKNRVFIASMCLVLAVLVGFVGVPIINHLTAQTVNIVCAKQDIPMGVKLTDEMVELVEVGKINLPENVAYSIDQVRGLYVTVDMKARDYITGVKVTNKLVLPENKIRNMEYGEQTYRIKLNDSSLIKLLPNDIVQFHTFDSEGKPITVRELSYVSVVTTTTSDGTDILYAAQQSAEGAPLVASTVTFILNKTQINKLLELEKSGNFKITLICRGENDNEVTKYLNMQEALFSGAVTVEGEE